MIRIAGGSVPGTDHTMPGQPGWKNNLDAYTWRYLPQGGVVAVVCDGCGSGKHSEVGAKLGTHLVAQIVSDEVVKMESIDSLSWQRIKHLVLGQLSTVAKAMGGSLSETISDYFLFTILGAIVTPEVLCVFSLGDGVYIINNTVRELGPFPGNSPPYLMYNLTGSELTEADPGSLDFQIHRFVSMSGFQSLILGTDGVMNLIQNAENPLPGKTDRIGPINQFLDDRYFANPDAIRRRLAIINRELVLDRIVVGGPLKDDTTVVVIRRDIP
ncbi:hypothetical protein A2635_03400 [Candidatus Peribacteria bacterium RIFCSPHIGHO2_01_FULL_51_9]|nr:MAG: hypothetical protein A2635_03400 [Candidatus Peribacteria bacterium RIFCSPHIGHO2_01_FULL_51_9]